MSHRIANRMIGHSRPMGPAESMDWTVRVTRNYDNSGLPKELFGRYLKGHTNLTEIDDALDLLWRNGIEAKNV